MAGAAEIPVIDIFAGPGGLGEGFSAFETNDGDRPFRLKLSIEKDACAHETLRLRCFYRQFQPGEAPECYYEVLRQKIPVQGLPDQLKEKRELLARWEAADHEALHAELGPADTVHRAVSSRIQKALHGRRSPWVLIGGPPCQAYSIVGRVRNRGNSTYRIESDQRSSLYREYLRIIADHWPAVFVMENVKGMLSATMQNSNVFERIIEDLQSPRTAFGNGASVKSSQRYRIVPLVRRGTSLLKDVYHPTDFVVACEQFGVPQFRHRVILVGIREDLGDVDLPALKPSDAPTVNEVIGDLPRLRSGLSRRRIGDRYVQLQDSPELWRQTIEERAFGKDLTGRRWLKALCNGHGSEVYDEVIRVVQGLDVPAKDRGGEFIEYSRSPAAGNPLRAWYRDSRLGGVCNHQSRAHMDSDLARYLFAACYASVFGISPKLYEFPADLQPAHENAGSGDFDDRFRVQVADQPSTTITSHMSKDGHYFIHPDSGQCRSRMLREATRFRRSMGFTRSFLMNILV